MSRPTRSTSSRLRTFDRARVFWYHMHITVVGVLSAHHGHHKGPHFLLSIELVP